MSYSPNFTNNTAKGAASSSRQVARNYINGSGSTLVQTTPLSVLSSGLVTTLDLTSKVSVDAFVGCYSIDTPNAASAQVADSGLIENITTSYSVGAAVWASKTGGLTNSPPTIGTNGFISGDYVLFVGVIVQNEFDNTKKDLKILIQKPGRL